jgi:hypothetical protein
MLRTCPGVITLIAMVTYLSMTAQAADAVLALAYQGTTTVTTMEDAKPEPISMGIIVNFTGNTVQGFGDPGFIDYPVKIIGIHDVTVSFRGSHELGPSTTSISGGWLQVLEEEPIAVDQPFPRSTFKVERARGIGAIHANAKHLITDEAGKLSLDQHCHIHPTRPGGFGRSSETEVIEEARKLALAFVEKAVPR